MKNQTTRHERPNRPAPPRPLRPRPAPDPIGEHARERRLYTDFLVLALYPGMNPTAPARRAGTAA